EVVSRSLSTGSQQQCWGVYHDGADSSRPIHAYTWLADAGSSTAKAWDFNWGGPPPYGLTLNYYEFTAANVTIFQKHYTWANDAAGNGYLGAVLTTQDPGTSYAVQSQSTQTLDIYGNITQSQIYDYGNLSTPARTYNYTYPHETKGTYL